MNQSPYGLCKCGICFEIEPMSDEDIINGKQIKCNKCKQELMRKGVFKL